jgi:hypothetical protein
MSVFITLNTYHFFVMRTFKILSLAVLKYIKNMWYMHTVECYLAIKRMNPVIWNNMYKPRGRYVK